MHQVCLVVQVSLHQVLLQVCSQDVLYRPWSLGFISQVLVPGRVPEGRVAFLLLGRAVGRVLATFFISSSDRFPP